MKTKLEIIDETVAFYSADTSRRAVNRKGCEYIAKDGRMCALGRCAQAPSELDDNMFAREVLRAHEDEEVFKPEYQGHSPDFWSDVQELHDEATHWDTAGITSFGRAFVEVLKMKYAAPQESTPSV